MSVEAVESIPPLEPQESDKYPGLDILPSQATELLKLLRKSAMDAK